MASFLKKKKQSASLAAKFDAAVATDTDAQCELFMKSFIFTLGDEWKTVVELSKSFANFVASAGNDNDCSCIQAAHFLQKNGKTRTGIQRKQELKDVDLNSDNRICFLEYLLLHYKAMILRAHYERTEKTCPFDLSGDGVGVVGCGPQLLEELFTFPGGLPADLQRALDEFFATKRAKAAKLKKLAKEAVGNVAFLRADVTNHKQMKDILNEIMQQAGRLDMLVNNAGVAGKTPGPGYPPCHGSPPRSSPRPEAAQRQVGRDPRRSRP